VRLIDLELEGYGKLADRRFTFAPGLTIVSGPNEAGKSTLVDAIVAALYGPGRKDERDAKRPWSGASYRGRLRYALHDGREFEIHRDFSKDGRTAKVFDRNGNDVTAEFTVNKNVVPGEVQLAIPREVFVNASCVRQQAVIIDDEHAHRIGASLAQALDGGPREDAARRALEALDTAIRANVGTDRAQLKNAPLRKALQDAADAEERADAARATLRALMETRERLSAAQAERERLVRSIAEHKRRGRAMQAASLRSRLDQLRKLREEIGALDAVRAQFDDVADFPEERLGELEALHRAWQECETRAHLTAEEARRAADAVPRDDAPRVDAAEETIAAAERAAAEVEEARAQAIAAANDAAAARRAPERDAFLGACFVVALLCGAVAVGCAIAHWWEAAAPAAAITVVFAALCGLRLRGRYARRAGLARLQSLADDASNREASAAATLAAILGPLGLASAGELRRRSDLARSRATLVAMAREADLRSREAQLQARAAALAFDELAASMIARTASRDGDVHLARTLAARRRERDGIENNRRMKDVLRADLLRGEDELALETQLAELLADGVDETGVPHILGRVFEAEGAELEQQLREAESAAARSEAEIAATERSLPDIAALDDEAAACRAQAQRLRAFAGSVKLARETIEARMREAHEKFARRLEDYAVTHLSFITAGRYSELRVDPATLAVRVRAPETREIVDLGALSAGTRDQIYLIVRFAMARMFAEGLETPPLLLDDPFAYWDAGRLERCLPVVVAGSETMQTIICTSSAEFAQAAGALDGAHQIVLDSPVLA
jgi:uncharacterized protein YhaN